MSEPVSQGPLLAARDVHHAYGERPVLAGVSLAIRAGERVALTGPSGSGKTTLLNLLGGVDRPTSGHIDFDGTRLGDLDGDGLAALRRRHVGTVFQFFHLLPTLSAFENVELPLQLLDVPAAERRDRVASLLERVGVAHRADAPPGELSGGEMQRVAIARALVHRPRLLLADEPTSNLDDVRCAQVLELLQVQAAACGATLVIATHDQRVKSRVPNQYLLEAAA